MAALGYAKTKKTQVSTCRGEERSLPLPNPSSCVMAGSDDSYSVFTQTARKRQRIPVLAVRSYFQRHQHSHSPPASHTERSAPLPSSPEVVLHAGTLLAVCCWHCFGSLTAGAAARCSARQWTHGKRWFQRLARAGRMHVPLSKRLWSLVWDGKLILVSSYFQFLAPVLKQSGLSSSTNTRQTFVS